MEHSFKSRLLLLLGTCLMLRYTEVIKKKEIQLVDFHGSMYLNRVLV